MIVLGLVLVVVAAIVVLAAVFGGSNAPASLDLGILDLDITSLGVFLLGAATLLVLVTGLQLVRTGARRGYARRKQLREARRVVDAQRSSERERGESAADPAHRDSTPPPGSPS
ncbi:MAG TPA: hypothetical protein VFJ14_15425 [Nocardioidaceae bacterium]|nr:hypothetical protein [Nocardioidaceae bacterium]